MLQLVLGRAGSGKTEYVFSSIKKLVNDGENNILLITPEQFSFISERRLLLELGEANVNCVENSSFSRLADEISKKYGGDKLPVLSKGAKAVMMKKAIEMVQDSLVLFNKNINSSSFVNSVIKIYDEMKSCRVTCDDILNASKNADKVILQNKLSDISAIIGAYDALICDKYYDSANELTRLYEKLLKLEYFKDRYVFIDGFSGFIAQEYKILEVIISQAKCVYITFCSDSYNNFDKYDLFSYVNSNIAIIKDVTKKANSQFMNPIVLEGNKRAKCEELQYIERYAFSGENEVCTTDSDSVFVYSAKNITDECDHISSEISKLLRKGYNAENIAVICRDLDKYKRELEFSFDKFNVPYFNDERQNISTQPLIMFVNFLLRTMIYSYRSDDIFSMLKTGLTSLNTGKISELENYVFIWNINGSKWRQEFVQSPKGFAEEISDNDKKCIERVNTSRDYIISRLEKFIRSSRNKCCSDICKAVYFALIDFSVDENLKNLAISLDNNGKSALAEEQGRIWDLLMKILDKLAVVGGDEIITIKEFYKLFNLMISNEDLGTIPTGLDNVQLGGADRIRCDNPKVVFIAGANEGEFPQNVSSAGLLSESDRIALIKNDFKLYSYGETLNAQEKYFAYMAVASPSERLYVSYIGADGSGTESSIVTGIRNVCPNITVEHCTDELILDNVESIDNAFEILASNYNKNDEFVASLKKYFSTQQQYKSRVKAVERLIENDDIKITSSELATKLFSNDMYLSASRIENYFNCSFRYFCKYGVKARTRNKAEMDPMQTGTVIHYVLEKIILETGSRALAGLNSAEIKILVNKYLKDFLENRMGNAEQFTSRFKYQFMRLSKMIVCVVERLKAEFEQSDFEAKAFELKIGKDDEPVKSKIIPLLDGGSIAINGSIDRVDTYESNGKQYVRVVDYKSGNKDFQLSDVIYGLNLQMFIYLFTLCQSDNELSGISSGVLYMHSARSIFSLDRGAKDIDKKDNENFKMKGIVLNDEENLIAQHMEHDLQGKYIPVKFDDKKGFTGNIITLEQLGRLAKEIDRLVMQMGLDLHKGKISQNPVNGKKHDKTCEFCDYKYVCMNQREIVPRELQELTDSQVLNMIKEDDTDAKVD